MPARSTPSPAPQPIFFASPDEFGAWLSRHHATASEVWVGFHKRHTGRPSMTWPQSVDEALCHGWIDGVRKSIDGDRYMIRFTPRKPASIWSAINIARVAELAKAARMTPAGRAAFERRRDDKSAIYAYEQRHAAEFPPEMQRKLARNKKALAFFDAQPPHYRRTATYFVISAKRQETRDRRLAQLIECSARGEWLPQYLSAQPNKHKRQ